MLRFYLSKQRYIESLVRTTRYNLTELRIKYPTEPLYFKPDRKYLVSAYGSTMAIYDSMTNHIRINLSVYKDYDINEYPGLLNYMISRICISVTHEYLHLCFDGLNIPYIMEEFFILDILNTVY